MLPPFSAALLLCLAASASASSSFDPNSQAMDPALHRELAHEFAAGSPLRARTVTNLQTFTQALGGASAAPITNSGSPIKPFAVGADTFPDFASAATRTCNNQHNVCANMVNNGTMANGALTVADCDTQQSDGYAAELPGLG
ncbi:hypothetical protein BP6252_11462 [Coleophoma cylindrospora]|uniref:Uncharacterized protein n=1 Tax=Coleophoma cylindrospora TaxID=1849047 RepID=A0A3D8QJS5_9HELO|nr:hypothetical protein BP6252_11462 [Coleophoma cylindrospora]